MLYIKIWDYFRRFKLLTCKESEKAVAYKKNQIYRKWWQPVSVLARHGDVSEVNLQAFINPTPPSWFRIQPPDSSVVLLHSLPSCLALFGKKRAMQLVRHLRGDQHIFVKTVTGIVITVWVRRRDKIAALKCKLRSQAL
jgi:hypothetical protein